MIAVSSILAILSAVATNAPAFVALGGDILDMFDKGKALVSSDTASTPEERAEALSTIEGLQAQFTARLSELEQTAPHS